MTKSKKQNFVFRKQVIVIIIILLIIFSLVKFNEIRQKQLEVDTTVEGIVRTASVACSGQRSTLVARIFLSPKLYYLFEEVKDMHPVRYASEFDGKRIRVKGTEDGTLHNICLNGKDQQIPLLKIMDIEPLE